jgi:hypothetical protein
MSHIEREQKHCPKKDKKKFPAFDQKKRIGGQTSMKTKNVSSFCDESVSSFEKKKGVKKSHNSEKNCHRYSKKSLAKGLIKTYVVGVKLMNHPQVEFFGAPTSFSNGT